MGTIIASIGLIYLFIESNGDLLTGSVGWFGPIIFAVGVILHQSIKKALLEYKQWEKEKLQKKKQLDSVKKRSLDAKNKYSELIKKIVKEYNSIEIPISTVFKDSIYSNEKLIIEKSDKSSLYNLLKINEFLEDYLKNIKLFKDYCISRLTNYDKDSDEWYSEAHNNWGTRNRWRDEESGMTLNESILLDIEEIEEEDFKSEIEKFINTYWYYNNLALMSVAFLLNEKNIQYLEIYSAFEKLGTFDSSWQKQLSEQLEEFKDSLIDSLDTISNKLSNIDNNFRELNNNMSTLESSLNSIDSSIQTNNFLSAINIYQLHKIGKRINKS